MGYNINMLEIWNPAPRLPASQYLVSNLGRVKRLARSVSVAYFAQGENRTKQYHVSELICKIGLSTRGYPRINIGCGTQKCYAVHRLVAEAFITNPSNKPQVNHINGIKTDCRAENLEWSTNQENRDHAVATGLQPRGMRMASKLTDTDIRQIHYLRALGQTQRQIAAQFDVVQQTIQKIVTRKRWAHVV